MKARAVGPLPFPHSNASSRAAKENVDITRGVE